MATAPTRATSKSVPANSHSHQLLAEQARVPGEPCDSAVETRSSARATADTAAGCSPVLDRGGLAKRCRATTSMISPTKTAAAASTENGLEYQPHAESIERVLAVGLGQHQIRTAMSRRSPRHRRPPSPRPGTGPPGTGTGRPSPATERGRTRPPRRPRCAIEIMVDQRER